MIILENFGEKFGVDLARRVPWFRYQFSLWISRIYVKIILTLIVKRPKEKNTLNANSVLEGVSSFQTHIRQYRFY